MKTLAIILGVLIMGLNMFISFTYYKLFDGSNFTFQKRISLKILNKAIESMEDVIKKQSLVQLKLYYKILLFLFYLELIIVVSLLINVAHL
jgi:hypothetical protein